MSTLNQGWWIPYVCYIAWSCADTNTWTSRVVCHVLR